MNLASWFESTDDEVYVGFNSSGFMDCETMTESAEKEIFPALKVGKVGPDFLSTITSD